jgi:general stress protein 26
MTPDEQAAFLRDAKKAALATLDSEGFPHVVAMNIMLREGAIFMTSYGKAQKVVNIRRNPKVGVMIETGRKYSELRGVMIRGECEIFEDRATVESVMRAIRGIEGGAPANERTASSASKRVVLKVTPKKIASWDHSKLGGRY